MPDVVIPVGRKRWRISVDVFDWSCWQNQKQSFLATKHAFQAVVNSLLPPNERICRHYKPGYSCAFAHMHTCPSLPCDLIERELRNVPL